jgi:hypothetical protein
MTDISELHRLAPPPAAPVGVGSHEQWEEVSRKWNIRFPTDYIEFCNTYGAGAFFDEFGIRNPFESSDPLEEHSSLRDSYLDFKRSWPQELPFSYWPEPSGILYCGGDCNANTVYWKTQTDPEKWTVVVFSRIWIESEQYSGNLVQFLCDWLSGTLNSKILIPAAHWRKTKPPFVPRRSL